MNALMEAKLEKMRREQQAAARANFVAGLNAEVISGEENGELPEGYEGEETGDDGLNALMADRPDQVADAGRESEEIIENARMQAQQIIEEAIAEAEAQKAQVLEEARNTGYEEGAAKARSELEKAQAGLRAKEKSLEAEYDQLFDSIEVQLVDTITDIYQHIFSVELSEQRQILIHLIEVAMRRIEGTANFLVHVSAEDAAYVNMHKKVLEAATTLPGSSVEIIEDIGLSKNECFIETDGGIFDCSFDTELSDLTQKLRLLSYEK